MSDRDDEPIGYGRPPSKSRFKRGQSGNPSGRPKGSKNIATVLSRALRERVFVTENGRRRSITKLEASVKQLVNRAASGDERFMRQLLSLLAVVEGPGPSAAEAPEALSAADREVLAAIFARMELVASERVGEDQS